MDQVLDQPRSVLLCSALLCAVSLPVPAPFRPVWALGLALPLSVTLAWVSPMHIAYVRQECAPAQGSDKGQDKGWADGQDSDTSREED